MIEKKGRFITIEGIEGAGKTTAIQILRQWLSQANVPFITTREPGGTPLAETLRELVLHPVEEAACETTELLLLFAARAQHMAKVIVPALSAGQWVVSDRFTDATYAYQGGGRGIADEKIAFLEEFVQHTLKPDVVILLDVPVEQSLARLQTRSRLDRIEQESAGFFERVRAKYKARAATEPSRYRVIDNSGSVEALQLALERIMKTIN